MAQYRNGGAFMANEEHLRILRSGVDAWNEWIETNGVRPDLRFAKLDRAKLKYVSFMGADLVAASLRHANLRGASLYQCNLRATDLSGANLRETDLGGADLSGAVMKGANLTKAIVGSWFSNVSFQGVKGLRDVRHHGPCSIGIDTIEKTAADLASDPSDQQDIEIFLERAGVAKEYLEVFRSRIRNPIQFHSCFISYSSKDQAFADRLNGDLRQKGIRCWLATEDLKIGDRFRKRINEAIRLHDKLMVILSEHSVKSSWVEDEVETAFERERRDGTTVLFPIRLDDAVMDSDAAWAASIRRIRHIGDFSRWNDQDEYQKSLARLIRDLQAGDKNEANLNLIP